MKVFFLTDSDVDIYLDALECDKLLKNKNIEALLECNKENYLLKMLHNLLMLLNTQTGIVYNRSYGNTLIVSTNSTAGFLTSYSISSLSDSYTLYKEVIRPAMEMINKVLERLPDSKHEIISRLLMFANTNASSLYNYLENEKKRIYRERRIKRRLKRIERIELMKKTILDKTHPIFLENLQPKDFMDKNHFLRYWVIKKSIFKNKLSPKRYLEADGYILQEVNYIRSGLGTYTETASIIIGRDDTTNKLFVDIIDGTIAESTLPIPLSERIRDLMGYRIEYDEYTKLVMNNENIHTTVRIQGDLKMQVQSMDENYATRKILYTYFDELIWYLYRKGEAMDLLRKYIISFMPPFLRNLIGKGSYYTDDSLKDAFITDLIKRYPHVVDKFISKHRSDYTLYLGRPPHPHVIDIHNAIRIDQREFIVTKLSKVVVKHPEHGEKEIILPPLASISFFL